MKLADIQFQEPSFAQAEAVRLLSLRFATLDNWLRYQHFAPGRDQSGKRVFSFEDLLAIEATDMLVALFKMPPSVAAKMGRRASANFAPNFSQYAAWVNSDGVIHSRDDEHFYYVRDGDDAREVGAEEQQANSVMLALPVSSLAVELLQKIKASGAT